MTAVAVNPGRSGDQATGASLRQANELGGGHSLAVDATVLALELAKTGFQKTIAFRRRREREPFVHELSGELVEVARPGTVGIAASRMTSRVAIEIRRNVPQLVDHGRQLLFERLLEKPG